MKSAPLTPAFRTLTVRRQIAPALAMLAAIVSLDTVALSRGVQAADPPGPAPFTGEKTSWHGFDRYDFVMDTASLSLTPFKAPAAEGAGIGAPKPGQRRCVVVVPQKAAAGQPWSWRGCYWDHQPQTEVELLRRGFHIAYISADATLKPGKEWDAWYAFLTEKHGLSSKPAFIGMSRGGEYAYTWATSHPDKVACIYADNPGGNRDMMMKLGDLASNDVPLLLVCGSFDPLLGRFALPIENIYQQWGGRVTVMIKDGTGHHPHSLRDPQPLADWMEQNLQPAAVTPPPFLPAKFTRAAFYSGESLYREYPKEGLFLTCRGPGFVECYDRYAFDLPGVEGTITVITPRNPAAGTPWVLRTDFVPRDAAVDLALLGRGFHIVVGPVPYNGDGPSRAQWNVVYQHLTARGFSRKPVLEGAGGAAGEVYAWALANPDKVACVLAENPILRSHVPNQGLLENLAPLARAGVPLLHLCGSLDPWLETQTRVAEKNYLALGGRLTVIVKEGEGHRLTGRGETRAAVDFVLANGR